MKKLFAVVMIAGAVAATAAMARGNAAGDEAAIRVDLDEVNAKIDARLHVLLARQIALRQ